MKIERRIETYLKKTESGLLLDEKTDLVNNQVIQRYGLKNDSRILIISYRYE